MCAVKCWNFRQPFVSNDNLVRPVTKTTNILTMLCLKCLFSLCLNEEGWEVCLSSVVHKHQIEGEVCDVQTYKVSFLEAVAKLKQEKEKIGIRSIVCI